MNLGEFLVQRKQNPPEAEKCACGRPFQPRFSGGPRPRIDGKTVCDECAEENTARQAGPEPDLGGRGIHGPGVAAHLDGEDGGK